MKLSYTVNINSTTEKVFYWLKDPERAMMWQTSVSKTEILHETPDIIGTTAREIIEENGRSVEMHVFNRCYLIKRSHFSFRDWWSITKSAMGPEVIIFPAPFLNQDQGLSQSSEDLSIKQFVPQFTVK